MDRIEIALLGIGNVGKGVYSILSDNKDKIERNALCEIHVKKILVRDINKDRGIDIPDGILTNNIDDILHDDEIKLVVELMGGVKLPYIYITTAINKGKHVVTANKAVIATYGRELIDLADKKGVFLKYEASVAGGIPIISVMDKSLTANRIDDIAGIINGTTNYILSKMTSLGMSFADALKLAQDRGYAEADPTSDVSGQDAAYKLAILAMKAYGVYVDPEDISYEGIENITKADIKYASRLNYTIKLLAEARRIDKTVALHVHPTLVPNSHPLASVNGAFNALFLSCNAADDIMLYGRGAGSKPTGSAVLSDVIEIIHMVERGYVVKAMAVPKIVPSVVGEKSGKYYIRMEVKDIPGVLGLIATLFGQYDVSLASVVQESKNEGNVPLIFVTHEIERKKLNAALSEIDGLDYTEKIASILRVIDEEMQ